MKRGGAQNTADSEHTPQVQSAGSDGDIQQIRYNVNKVDKYREVLQNLIDPVFGAAAPPDCLATFTVMHFTSSSCRFWPAGVVGSAPRGFEGAVEP